jgi:hypothetical protein
MIISFGGTERQRLQIDIAGYERPPVGDYYGDNWLTVQISVSVGGFHGGADASFLTGEFVSFLSQLRPLYETLRGTAEFTTIEGQLRMKLAGDAKGHIELDGEVADRAGCGNRLSFTLQLDQTQLGNSIREIEAVLAEFPVRKP